MEYNSGHEHSKFRFFQINLKLNIDFHSQFCVSSAKLPSVPQRSVSQENAFKKSKNPSLFLAKTIGSNISFTLIENNFRFLRLVEFNVTVNYGLGQNASSCKPLMCLSSMRFCFVFADERVF